MYCVKGSHVCVMVQDKKTGEYKYIKEKVWIKMNAEQKAQYDF